jgi:hypothetical protein
MFSFFVQISGTKINTSPSPQKDNNNKNQIQIPFSVDIPSIKMPAQNNKNVIGDNKEDLTILEVMNKKLNEEALDLDKTIVVGFGRNHNITLDLNNYENNNPEGIFNLEEAMNQDTQNRACSNKSDSNSIKDPNGTEDSNSIKDPNGTEDSNSTEVFLSKLEQDLKEEKDGSNNGIVKGLVISTTVIGGFFLMLNTDEKDIADSTNVSKDSAVSNLNIII